MQETYKMQFQSLDQEDPLEEGMATHSNILVCRMTWYLNTKLQYCHFVIIV